MKCLIKWVLSGLSDSRSLLCLWVHVFVGFGVLRCSLRHFWLHISVLPLLSSWSLGYGVSCVSNQLPCVCVCVESPPPFLNIDTLCSNSLVTVVMFITLCTWCCGEIGFQLLDSQCPQFGHLLPRHRQDLGSCRGSFIFLCLVRLTPPPSIPPSDIGLCPTMSIKHVTVVIMFTHLGSDH